MTKYDINNPMPKELTFSVSLEDLILHDWYDMPISQQTQIKDVVTKNKLHIRYWGNNHNMIAFEGTPENLFYFLNDIAYHFNISII